MKGWQNAVTVACIFACGLGGLWLALNSLPALAGENTFVWSFPRNLDQVKQIQAHLQKYYEQHFLRLLLGFAYTYVFKQTFSIPGSFVLNLLAGAIFGLIPGIWPIDFLIFLPLL